MEKMHATIEYETMTVKVPKKLMDFLRSMAGPEGKTPIEQLETGILEYFKANLEALTGSELIQLFELGPIFNELLN